ncbi:MAG TPA: DUF1292 domain-containing protein [Clostridia bacterium]|jgi:uncharacterized protein YrzB (UPF0473 family)|nr:DUF1292 domain-containing protein [Clostridia bacterium]
MPDNDLDLIELLDEDGKQFQFRLIEALEIDEKKYAILLPLDQDDEEALVLRVETGEDGEELLVEIEDDEEWEMVAQVWNQVVEEDLE